MKPNDIIEWTDGKSTHRWKVRGVHLGGEGVESLIEIENVTHKAGWTGQWETHQMMFVPECLLRKCKVIDGRTPKERERDYLASLTGPRERPKPLFSLWERIAFFISSGGHKL